MGIKAGIQLHLPIIDAMMSRTGWSEAFKQVKIAGGPFTDKPMLREIKSNKPFLLLHIDYDTLTADQQYLLQASDYIGHFLYCDVFACYPARILANDSMNKDKIISLLPGIKTGDTCLNATGTWFANHFDTGTSIQKLFGKGAMPYLAGENTIINTVTLKPADNMRLYEFSCWVLVSDKDYKSPYFLLESLDSEGNIIATTEAWTKESTDNYGLWLRNQAMLNIPSGCAAIRFRLMNVPADSYLAMDELMLRPANATIISKNSEGKVMVNNHIFNFK